MKILVSSIEMSFSILFLSKYCLPINQERGVINSKEKRGKIDSTESKDCERRRIRARDKLKVVLGGFWKATVKRRK
jgi:hypothetical protein